MPAIFSSWAALERKVHAWLDGYGVELLSDIPDILTVSDAAKSLTVGRSTMSRLLRDGEVCHIRIELKITIPAQYLIQFIEMQADTHIADH